MLKQKLDTWSHADPESDSTLPSRFFYDEGIFREERDRIFYPGWHAVAHRNELKEPGSFVTHDFLDQSVIVVKGQDGEVRAFHNVCQHRGNRLVEERRGRAPTLLRCAYHSWCYAHDGSLRSAPRTNRLQDFDRDRHGLRPVKLEQCGGFWFVNLDPDAAPLADMTQGAEAEMRRFLPDLDRMELIQEVDVPVAANWKVIMDNSIEGYHFDLSGPVHKVLTSLIDFKGYSLTPHDKWWTYIGPPKAGVNSAYGESLEGSTYQTDWFFNIGVWPNTTFYCFPYTDLLGTFIMIPTGPESSLLRFGYYTPDGRMPAVTKAAIRWMNEELGPEDIQLNLTQQRGLRSLGYDQGRYLIDPERSNESEHLVHHFHSLVYQALRP